MKEIPEDACTDLLPLPVEVGSAGLDPTTYCRGFSAAGSGTGTIIGSNLTQVTSIDVPGLTGVTVAKQLTSTDTQLNVKVDITGGSALGNSNLQLNRVFGPPHVMTNAITVQRFEALSITPNTGARGDSVNITISGTCFDPSALIQQVQIAGLGVTVVNVIVMDSTTITCVFEIGGLAPLAARNVTVKTGTNQHTLIDAFTVTS